MKAMKKRKASNDGGKVAFPCCVTVRKRKDGRKGEAYIEQNTRTARYVVGLLEQPDSENDYVRIIQCLCNEINAEGNATFGHAKKRLKEIVDGALD